MSKKKIKNQIEKSVGNGFETIIPSNSQAKSYAVNDGNPSTAGAKFSRFKNWLSYLKSHALLTAVICFLGLGTMGAGLKYLDDSARQELALRAANKNKLTAREETFLNKINPFLPAALPNPTPQLSKEYIYAGSRMLAVEDKNAAALTPLELTVFRPGDGTWYFWNGTTSQISTAQWGMNGDIPVPGDYDGDGKADLAIYRKATGQTSQWWIFKSSDSTYYQFNFGLYNDKIAQADYDGDGKTDIAVWRPSEATWYISQSSNGAITGGQFGVSTDTPTPADFDGDGRTDLAVWRSSNLSFYSLKSTNLQYTVYSFPQPNPVSTISPVPADYDGDGRADYAIRNGADWIIHRSSGGQNQTISWEQAGDTAVPYDYDRDGKADIAVWRESTGTWYIRKSGSNGALQQQQWGLTGDFAAPAYYGR